MTDQEINEAVARKLGWVDCEFSVKAGNNEPTTHTGLKDPKTSSIAVPKYATDIKAAFEILTEHCEEWTIQCPGPFVYVDLQTKNYDRASADADTAPRAICMAFLKLP